MKRVLLAIGITVVLSTIALALMLASGDETRQAEAERFVKLAWTNDPAEAIGALSPGLLMQSPMERVEQRLRYYRTLLGPFIETEDVVSSELTDRGKKSTLVLRMKFERASSVARFEFEKLGETWVVSSFAFEVPEALHPKPEWKHVRSNAEYAVRSWTEGNVEALRDYFTPGYRDQYSTAALEREHAELSGGLGGGESVEYVDHEELGDGRRKMRFRIQFENGAAVMELTLRWRFAEGTIERHDVRRE